MIFLNILLLVIGMVLLIKGADFFVDGSSKIAKALKISPLIIGLTLVSIGTSLPELSVSVNSAIHNLGDMSFGNVIGSNIFNVLVVIGACSLFIPMVADKMVIKCDLPILIGIYALLFLFAFGITPNVLDLTESIIIFALFIGYITFLIIRGIKGNKNNETQEEEEKKSKRKWYINVLFIIVGLAGIIGGGELVVNSAKEIALSLGMSELLVALTIVAVGTSLPELVTSIVAAKKGENDIAIGNAIGSSVFNILLILGISSMIRPIKVADSSIVDMIVMLVSVVLVFAFSFKTQKIGRKIGIVLLVIYILYLTYIILRNIYPSVFSF